MTGSQSPRRAVLVAVALLMAAACADAPATPPASTVPLRDGRAPAVQPAPAGAAPGVARAMSPANALAAMHARKTDWVGQAHNAALRAFAAQLTRGGAKGGSLCKRMERFLAEMPQPAGGSLPTGAARRDAVTRSLAVVRGCAAPARTAAFGGAPLHLARQVSTNISLQADQYRIEMEDDIMNAVDDASLAAALNDVVQRAYATLSEEEAEVVETAASVGLNSYEYWQDNFDSYSTAVGASYGSCFDTYIDQGYSDDAIQSTCLGRSSDVPSLVAPTRRGAGRAAAASRFAASRRTQDAWIRPAAWRPDDTPAGLASNRFCGTALGTGLKKMAISDAHGAFMGGVVGAAGGPGGILAGALLGGVGESAWTAGELSIESWRCAMRI